MARGPGRQAAGPDPPEERSLRGDAPHWPQATKDHETLVRQLDGLLADSSHSARVLASKLTRHEQERISAAIEKGKKARKDGSIEDQRAALQDMERAATLIGQAILRP